MIVIDTSELRTLAADLTAAGDDVPAKVKAVITKAATNIKSQMRSEASGSGSFGHIAPTITYDLRDGGLEAEIGPTKPRGALAAIAYFGGSHGGGGTVADPTGAMEAEAPRLEKAMGDVLEGLL